MDLFQENGSWVHLSSRACPDPAALSLSLTGTQLSSVTSGLRFLQLAGCTDLGGLRVVPHPPPRFLPRQPIPRVLSNHVYGHREAREESERRGQPLGPQKLSRYPLILPPPCCPLAKLGTTSLPDLEKLEGEVNPDVARRQSRPGVGRRSLWPCF